MVGRIIAATRSECETPPSGRLLDPRAAPAAFSPSASHNCKVTTMHTSMTRTAAAARQYHSKGASGSADDDGVDGATNALIRGEFARISAEGKARGAELDARLLSVEQRQARSSGGGSGAGDGFGGGVTLGSAAEPLAKALKDANNSRSEVVIGVKALSSTAPGALGSTQYAVPVQTLAPIDVYHSPLQRLVDLLPVEPVVSNLLQYVRVGLGANAAAEAVELSDKAESALSTLLVQVEIPTWAHYVTTSRQVIADVPVLRSLIDGILQRGLLDRIDAGSYATLTTAGNFTAFVPTVGDRFGDAVARIAAQIANQGGRDIIVCLNPGDYLAMSLVKAVTSGEYLGLPPTLTARIAAVAAVAPGKILAFAPGTGASYGDRMAVVVEAGYVNAGFTQNKVVLLSEARGACFIRDQAHVAFGSLPAAA